jgi:hypothetical protein
MKHAKPIFSTLRQSTTSSWLCRKGQGTLHRRYTVLAAVLKRITEMVGHTSSQQVVS